MPVTEDYPTTIRIDPELKRQLTAYAKAQGASFSWYVANILRQHVNQKKQKDDNK